MTKSSLSLCAGAVAVLAVVLAATTTAQAPQAGPGQAGPGQAGPGQGPQGQPGGAPRTFPKPTNLKVLPKDLTGAQVREIMEGWEGALGGNCATCHAADPKNIGPNGRPRLNFADDSKKEKQVARMMYQMTQEINANYVSMVQDSSGVPVTCGTCHRGHNVPEAFVTPKEHEHHEGHEEHEPAGVGK